MLKNNILTRIYELQGKLAEIVNELDELEKLVNSEDISEEVAEAVEPREIVFEKRQSALRRLCRRRKAFRGER